MAWSYDGSDAGLAISSCSYSCSWCFIVLYRSRFRSISSATMAWRCIVGHNRLPRTSVVGAFFQRHAGNYGTHSLHECCSITSFSFFLCIWSRCFDMTKVQRLMSMRFMYRVVEHSERPLAYAVVRLSQRTIGAFTAVH